MQSFLGDQSNQKLRDPPTLHAFTLDAILQDIDRLGAMNSLTRSLLTLKLQEIVKLHTATDSASQKKYSESVKALWRYTEKKFYDLQMWFDNNSADEKQQISANLEILQMITKKLTSEDF